MLKKILITLVLLCTQPLLAQEIKRSQHQQDTAPLMAHLVTALSTDTRISVSWKLPEDNRVSNVQLYRKTYELPMQSSKGLDVGELIAELDASKLSYLDSEVEANKRYYYRVVVLNEADQKSNPSLPAIASLKDLTPPLPVASLIAKVLDPSQLKLRWTASESDDVVSYRIYRARDKSPAVIVKTIALTKKGERFFNTIVKQKKNLQIDYHYAVAAIDGAGNVSVLSDYTSVRLPDSVPPQNPLQLSIKQYDGMLELNWLPGTENDLAGYRVYRKNNSGPEQQPLQTFKPLHKGLVKVTQYIDHQIKPLSSYRYRVAAVDIFGNESKPGRGVAVRSLSFDTVIPVPARLAIINDNKGYPKLSWQLENNPADIKIRVYRSEGSDFQAVSSLLETNQFTDHSVIGGKAYKYQVKAVSEIGEQSSSSNTVLWTGGRQ